MITKDNPSLNSTAESIYMSNADINILEQCRAREDAIAHEKYQKELIESLNATIADRDATIADKDATIADKDATIADNKALIAELQAKVKAYECQQ